MFVTIADVLTPADLAEIREGLAKLAFVDGRATAGWNAKLVKANRQAAPGPGLAILQERVRERLAANPVFSLAARPRTFSQILFARYGASDAYGTHVDDAIMGGIRTDVSFTIFLTDPDTYEGGELVIETTAGEEPIKLPAGSVYLYPATTLHRVAPVVSGERTVAVGWVRSLLRSSEQRELLFDLDTARRALFAREGKSPEFDLLSKCTANLLRMWAED